MKKVIASIALLLTFAGTAQANVGPRATAETVARDYFAPLVEGPNVRAHIKSYPCEQRHHKWHACRVRISAEPNMTCRVVFWTRPLGRNSWATYARKVACS